MQRVALRIYNFLIDLKLASMKFDFEPLRQIHPKRTHDRYQLL